MVKKRAIYMGDINQNYCMVFELNEETDSFIMLEDNHYQYHKDVVTNKEGFLVFEVDDNKNINLVLEGH